MTSATFIAAKESLTTPEDSSDNVVVQTNLENSVSSTDHTDEIDEEQMGAEAAGWEGWAELENDPLIFSAIVRAWGVQGVGVNEVIPLDTILEREPSSVLGLIFLSRWAVSEANDQPSEYPTGLWFANQISTYSCATLALMNIIQNHDELDLGLQLNEFRSCTKGMNPKARGIELDKYRFVKDIHNSFSRELDRLNVDLHLKEQVQASSRKSRKPRKNFTKRKKKRAEDEEENGFHFVAYVPAKGRVWRLDGTEPRPKDMGPINSGTNWLNQVVADLQMCLDAVDSDGMEFSLLSVDRTPDICHSDADEATIARIKEDWSPLFFHMLQLHADKGDIEMLLEY